MMPENKKRQLVFRCDVCRKIEIFELSDDKEIQELKDGVIYFECVCQEGILELLLN